MNKFDDLTKYELVELLAQHEFDSLDNGDLQQILVDGCVGYDNMPLQDLKDAAYALWGSGEEGDVEYNDEYYYQELEPEVGDEPST